MNSFFEVIYIGLTSVEGRYNRLSNLRTLCESDVYQFVVR